MQWQESLQERVRGASHAHTEKKEMRRCRDVVASQRMPAATRRWKIKESILSQSLQRECAYRHHELRILASWTLREYTSIVLSNPVCGSLLHNSQKKWIHPSFFWLPPSLLLCPLSHLTVPLEFWAGSPFSSPFSHVLFFHLDWCWNLTRPQGLFMKSVWYSQAGSLHSLTKV